MEDLNLPKPVCRHGYSVTQLKEWLGDEKFSALMKWMYGQTMSICDGRSYNHETKEYESNECTDSPHGLVVYSWDLDRFLKGLPVID